MNLKKIKRAIISVSDKSTLKEILPTLKNSKLKSLVQEDLSKKYTI